MRERTALTEFTRDDQPRGKDAATVGRSMVKACDR